MHKTNDDVNFDLRLEKGLISYREIAEQARISEVTVWRWFNNKNLSELRRATLLKAIKEIKEGDSQ